MFMLMKICYLWIKGLTWLSFPRSNIVTHFYLVILTLFFIPQMLALLGAFGNVISTALEKAPNGAEMSAEKGIN